jgi:hypothetical protein
MLKLANDRVRHFLVMAMAVWILCTCHEVRSQEFESLSGMEQGEVSPWDGGHSSLHSSIDAGGTDFEQDVNDVPLDGGLSLLLAAGAAFGVRRVRRRK